MIRVRELRNRHNQSHGRRFLVAKKRWLSVVKPRSKHDRLVVACDPGRGVEEPAKNVGLESHGNSQAGVWRVWFGHRRHCQYLSGPGWGPATDGGGFGRFQKPPLCLMEQAALMSSRSTPPSLSLSWRSSPAFAGTHKPDAQRFAENPYQARVQPPLLSRRKQDFHPVGCRLLSSSGPVLGLPQPRAGHLE